MADRPTWKIMKTNFPLFYHIHHSLQLEDIPLWKSLAKDYGGPVLELGCGTGRVLIPLVEAGFVVFGLDNDPEMLSFLRKNLPPALEQNTHTFLADLSAFHLSIEFPIILMPCNTLSTLSKQTRIACLENVYRHLSPQGVFAVSLPNPLAFRELPDYGPPELEETIVDPRSESHILVSSEWRRVEDRFVVQWHYDRQLPEGNEERLTVAVSHDLSLREDYLKEMKIAGFQKVASYGDFRGTHYRAASPDLILIARKGVHVRK